MSELLEIILEMCGAKALTGLTACSGEEEAHEAQGPPVHHVIHAGRPLAAAVPG